MSAEVFLNLFIQMYFIPMQQTKDLSQETFSNWQEATCGLNLEYFGVTSDRSSPPVRAGYALVIVCNKKKKNSLL